MRKKIEFIEEKNIFNLPTYIYIISIIIILLLGIAGMTMRDYKIKSICEENHALTDLLNKEGSLIQYSYNVTMPKIPYNDYCGG